MDGWKCRRVDRWLSEGREMDRWMYEWVNGRIDE